MKKLALLLVLWGSIYTLSTAQVTSNIQQPTSINEDGSTPDASAILEIQAADKGILIPRMNLVARDLIGSPATGLLIYQTDSTPGFYYFDGSNWVAINNALPAGGMEGQVLTVDMMGNPVWGVVSDIDADPTNEIQDLSLVGNTLTITNNGNATDIDLSQYLENVDTTSIGDSDNDTRIYVEKNPDEDKIRFDVQGNEAMIINDTGSVSISNNLDVEGKTAMNTLYVGPSFLSDAAQDTTSFIRGNLTLWGEFDLKSFHSPNDLRLGSRMDTVFADLPGGIVPVFDGGRDIYIGDNAGYYEYGATGSPWGNVFIGNHAGHGNRNGIANTILGSQAGLNIGTASGNTYVGYKAGYNSGIGQRCDATGCAYVPTPRDNVIIGKEAGYQFQGDSSVIIGLQAAYDVEGGRNVFLGSRTGYSMELATRSILIGDKAGGTVSSTTDNIYIGADANYLGSGGAQSILLGNRTIGTGHSIIGIGYETSVIGEKSMATGFRATVTGEKSIALGYEANATCNNCAVIGGTGANALKVGIGTDDPQQDLHVVGRARITDIPAGSGTIVGVDGNGDLVDLGTLTEVDGDPTNELITSAAMNGDNLEITDAGGTTTVDLSPLNPAEDDPEVGANTTNYLPKWDGSALVASTSVSEDGSGNVGIGINVPMAKFHLNTPGLPPTDNAFRMGGEGKFVIDAPGVIGGRMTVEHNGNVGIGTNNPSHPLDMGSGAHCTSGGTWTNASDRRLKTDIAPISYGLFELMSLRPVSYRMKSNKEEQIGFIAQEVRDILPELISGTEGEVENGETLGMSYGNLTAVLVKAVQEQQMQIEELRLENENLQSQLTEMDKLKQRMAKLESALLGTPQGVTATED